MGSKFTAVCSRCFLAAVLAVGASFVASVFVTGIAAAALPPGCSQSGQTVTCTYTSGSNPFTVPSGVSSVHVVAVGGKGGDSFLPQGCGAGAFGAVVSGDVLVTPGSTLYANVGGNGGGCPNTQGSGGTGGGGNAGGSFGAGGGGGASDVRTSQTDLSTRLLVAAGGGGGGEVGVSCDVSSGSCLEALFGGEGGVGGAGGGNPGAAGGGVGGGAGGGGGGTIGGVGGAACLSVTVTACAGGVNGGDGGSGTGGDGGAGGNNLVGSVMSQGGGGGGGGGGWFGGGGGGGGAPRAAGAGSSTTGGGGGGGGGSNLVPAGGSRSIDTTGVPMVQISYTILHPTATAVTCAPSVFAPGGATVCKATVTDTASSGPTTPTGKVSFTNSGSGTFGGSPCTLSASGASATCSVFFSSFPIGGQTITAIYSGDTTHAASSGTMMVAVALPASTRGCVVYGHGRITAANGDKASFRGLVAATPPAGAELYRDNGPADAFRLVSTSVKALTCSSDATQASVFGTATVTGGGSVQYRIDVQLTAWRGRQDTYRIRLSDGYDSGAQRIRHGDIDIHTGFAEHHHHDANADHYKPGAAPDGG